MTVPIAQSNFESALKQGIYRHLEKTWELQAPVFEELNNAKAFRLPNVGTRTSKFGFHGSFGRPEIWDFASGRRHQGIDDYEIDVTMVPFEQTIDIHSRDRKHTQLSDPRQYIASSTHRFLQIPQRQMRDYQEGTTDANITLHTAWDGATLYSATEGDGSTDRHSVSGGNILTGFTRTKEGLHSMLKNAQELFLAFKDTKGEDLIFQFSDVSFDKFMVEVPRTMAGLVQDVAEPEFARFSADNNVSESNLYRVSEKYRFKYQVNNELTNQNNFYIHLLHNFWKPFVMIQEESINSIWADHLNSDRSREFNVEGLYNDQESGCAPWATWVTLKVTA